MRCNSSQETRDYVVRGWLQSCRTCIIDLFLQALFFTKTDPTRLTSHRSTIGELSNRNTFVWYAEARSFYNRLLTILAIRVEYSPEIYSAASAAVDIRFHIKARSSRRHVAFRLSSANVENAPFRCRTIEHTVVGTCCTSNSTWSHFADW